MTVPYSKCSRFKEGKSDGIIMLNGIEKYIYYTPLNINDWYILTVVP
jgi:hypothetical protein